MNLEQNLKKAVKVLKEADALFVTAGHWMSVDSGLPNLEQNESLWKAFPAYKKEKLTVDDLDNPHWFTSKAHLAWGYYGHLMNLFRSTKPHVGYQYLLNIAFQKTSYFIYTTNTDSHFAKAGFDPLRITQHRGSLDHVQCIHNCKGEIVSAENINLEIDFMTYEAKAPLPKCPDCGSFYRPNLVMKDDETINLRKITTQNNKLRVWANTVKQAKLKVAILELGADPNNTILRNETEGMLQELNATLIRANATAYTVPKGQISLPLGPKLALQQIEQRM